MPRCHGQCLRVRYLRACGLGDRRVGHICDDLAYTPRADARSTLGPGNGSPRTSLRFIDEAAKSITDALTHELDDPSKLVRLYALVGKLRLFASANVVSQAEEVMQRIVETYNLPNRDFHNPEDRRRQDADLLRAFSEACREDLCV